MLEMLRSETREYLTVVQKLVTKSLIKKIIRIDQKRH